MEKEKMLRYLLAKLSHEELVDQLVKSFKEFHPTEEEQQKGIRDLVRYFHARKILLLEQSIEDVPEEDRDAVRERVDSILENRIVELQV